MTTTLSNPKILDTSDAANLIALQLRKLYAEAQKYTAPERMLAELLEPELVELGDVHDREEKGGDYPQRDLLFSLEYGVQFGIAATMAVTNLTPRESREHLALLVQSLRATLAVRIKESRDFFAEENRKPARTGLKGTAPRRGRATRRRAA
jgi:hypothetical protein